MSDIGTNVRNVYVPIQMVATNSPEGLLYANAMGCSTLQNTFEAQRYEKLSIPRRFKRVFLTISWYLRHDSTHTPHIHC